MSARDGLPMHELRSASNPRRGRPFGASRLAVAAAVGAATGNPLSSDEIASRTGVEVHVVRVHLFRMMRDGLAHNTGTPGKRSAARYAPGPHPSVLAQPRPTTQVRAGTYDGRELRPFAGRPGALDAFTLPSLQNGERQAYRAPAAMASHVPGPRR